MSSEKQVAILWPIIAYYA